MTESAKVPYRQLKNTKKNTKLTQKNCKIISKKLADPLVEETGNRTVKSTNIANMICDTLPQQYRNVSAHTYSWMCT